MKKLFVYAPFGILALLAVVGLALSCMRDTHGSDGSREAYCKERGYVGWVARGYGFFCKDESGKLTPYEGPPK